MRILEAGALVALACSAALAGDGRHDGEFSSSRPDHLTELGVLEGENSALIEYAGMYGPGCGSGRGWCRSCDMPPRTGRREASGSYLLTDESGKVRLSLVKKEWRLELVEGAMGSCGAGWGWDSFPADNGIVEPCVIVSATASWYRFEDTKAVAAGTTVAEGTSVQTVDAPLAGNQDYVMARAGTLVGVLKRTDLRCEGP